MARLIDADALKAQFDEQYDDAFMQMHTRANKGHWESYSIGINWGRNTIADASTVDAVPVVHGRWEAYPSNRNIRCTNCKMEFSLMHMSYTRNYCPNCGAKTDLEVKDA